PDEFNTLGQDWGLPPFVPHRLRRAGYRPFVETLRAQMARGGALRIDHVMGLFRQFWIPAGEPPTRGAYVRYPHGELLDIFALESTRARAVVVGEDLERSSRECVRSWPPAMSSPTDCCGSKTVRPRNGPSCRWRRSPPTTCRPWPDCGPAPTSPSNSTTTWRPTPSRPRRSDDGPPGWAGSTPTPPWTR